MSNGPLRLLAGAGAGDDPVYVDDVFATSLWEGDSSSSRSINNGIDLDGEGGLVWIKGRDSALDHNLYDTVRGATKEMYTNKTDGEQANTNALTSFNSNGFSIGDDMLVNNNNTDYVSWAFRKQEKFFDIVTWTGSGSTNHTINHNLGSTPGVIIWKKYNSSDSWGFYHRDVTGYLLLNETNTKNSTVVIDNVTSTSFRLKYDYGFLNGASNTYVAYLFGQGDAEYGEDGDESLIKVGAYNGNGGTNTINLGFEPQWMLFKSTSSTHDWIIADSMRGMANTDVNTAHRYLYAQSAQAEEGYAARFDTTPSGITLDTGATAMNGSGNYYIYLAIARPHKPASEFAATDLLAVDESDNSDGEEPKWRTTFPVDFAIDNWTTQNGSDKHVSSRLLQGKYLRTNTNNSESSESAYQFDYMNGFYADSGATSGMYAWMFRRAKGFFDVLTYVGDGTTSHAVNHNLGVAPELIIVKNRTRQANWSVYHQNSPVSGSGKRYNIMLQADNAAGDSDFWPSAPTATQFVLGDSDQGVNRNGDDYIAYLFATANGISKVGGYTGTDVDTDIDCGFSNGARFILIKRTDGSGNWYLLDSVRGYNFGTDSYTKLDTTDVATTGNMLNVESTGFNVSAGAGTNGNSTINILNATYIFLAIA